MTTLAIGNANWAGEFQSNETIFVAGRFFTGSITGVLHTGVLHFGSIPDGNSYPTGDTLLTDATLQFNNAGVSGSSAYDIYVVVAQDSAPASGKMARWRLARIGTWTPAGLNPTLSLKFQQPGYGGTVRIPDALQAAWRQRNLPYTDPYTGLASPHMLTFVFRIVGTPAGTPFMQVLNPVADITLTTTEVPADYGHIGHQYVRSYDLGIASGIVYDFKTGEPCAADEAITDGYLSGQLVRAENWDPRDRGAAWRRRLWPRTRLPRQSGGSR